MEGQRGKKNLTKYKYENMRKTAEKLTVYADCRVVNIQISKLTYKSINIQCINRTKLQVGRWKKLEENLE